jgi:hypothetical protein
VVVVRPPALAPCRRLPQRDDAGHHDQNTGHAPNAPLRHGSPPERMGELLSDATLWSC